MPTQADVRRIALSLPETTEDPKHFCFYVEGKQFAWVWLERVTPRAARVPNATVIAVRVADDLDKRVLLASDPEVFFTEPHYNGYPAVLVRLPAIDRVRLDEVLENAWRCRVSRRLLAAVEMRPREVSPTRASRRGSASGGPRAGARRSRARG